MADSIAKVAAKKTEPQKLTLPFTDLFSKFKTAFHLETHKKIVLQSTTKGQKYFQQFYKFSSELWFSNNNLSR